MVSHTKKKSLSEFCNTLSFMAVFSYKRLDAQGRLEKKIEGLPFEDIDAAHRYLERHRATVLALRRLPKLLAPLGLLVQYGFTKITRPEMAELFNNLSMMIGAGVTVLNALQEVQEDMKNKRLLGITNFMISDISIGQTFSEAIARHPNAFSPIILHMARIGEETGRLDKMLKSVADHLLHIEHIVSNTKRALIYPAFLMCVVTGAVVFWFWYVVPQIVTLFEDIGVELPGITKLLIFISEAVQTFFIPGVVLAVALALGLYLARRYVYKVRYASDWLLLRTPVISNIVHTSTVARVSENLGILIGAGVTVLRTLEIITDSMQNVVYKERMLMVQEEIKLGNTLSTSMRRASALHPFAIRMIGVGEETARLEEQTAYVAAQYRERLDNLVQALSKSLEPALLVFMGGLFALIVAGLLLPIYDLVTTMGM